MYIFRKSKMKIIFLITFFSITIAAGLIAVVFILSNGAYRAPITVAITSYIVFFITTIIKIKPQFKERLEITDNEIMSTGNASFTKIRYQSIERIQYHGTKIIPMSEMIGIQAGLKTIYIDFNFKNYRSIWKEVVQRCEGNENIQIDPRIYNRLP